MGALIHVRLTPRGGRNALDGFEGDLLKARVSSPPVKGAANEALCELLARALNMPKSQVSIRAGASGRVKIVEVNGIDLAEALSRLNRSMTQS